MSDLMKTCQLYNSKDCLALSSKSINQKINVRMAKIGDNLTIRRVLPHHDRKTIGAWCFLDHFGPLDLTKNDGLRIGPHPHIGLQTFTYPLSGEIRHRDSLGSNQIIKAGQVNIMTAGKGISHSEESLSDMILHGVQLWIALPDNARHTEPNFFHYDTIPEVILNGLKIKILAGEFLNLVSPVKTYSPLLGLEIKAMEDSMTTLPLNPNYEYGILPLIGHVEIANEKIDQNTLIYFSCGQSELPIRIQENSVLLVIGGEPFHEDILIWWNFVARTKEEMIQALADWDHHTERFGEVRGYQGDRLNPPNLP